MIQHLDRVPGESRCKNGSIPKVDPSTMPARRSQRPHAGINRTSTTRREEGGWRRLEYRAHAFDRPGASSASLSGEGSTPPLGGAIAGDARGERDGTWIRRGYFRSSCLRGGSTTNFGDEVKCFRARVVGESEQRSRRRRSSGSALSSCKERHFLGIPRQKVLRFLSKNVVNRGRKQRAAVFHIIALRCFARFVLAASSACPRANRTVVILTRPLSAPCTRHFS